MNGFARGTIEGGTGSEHEDRQPAGKRTLTQSLPVGAPAQPAGSAASGGASAFGASDPFDFTFGGAAKADLSDGGVRALHGDLAEGSHPAGGVKKGGPGKRQVGVISGGSFQKTAAPAAGGGAAPGGAPAPGQQAGREGERAFVGNASTPVADRTTTDGTTSVRMEDENDAQATMIADAVTRARAILDNAIAVMGSPTTGKAPGALQANFHSTDDKVVRRVTAGLTKIRNAFNGTIPVEVESEGTSRAYVYVIWSDIHLCPPWFADPSADARARTIIHECSHKYDGTDDKAYHWDPAFATLSTKDALNNADSYAWFCIDVL